MMSVNPTQVMATLRMMGDKELGQYAAMHKKDPYIFPLAFQESTMRKQMRAQGVAQQGQQQAPPVADQALAAMQQLPENTGIAQIAPPNVAQMASGGIVGFADGGSPERTFRGARWSDLPLTEAPPPLFGVKRKAIDEWRIDPLTGKAISQGEFLTKADGVEEYSNEGRSSLPSTGPEPVIPAAPAAKNAAPQGPAGPGGSASMSLRAAVPIDRVPLGAKPADYNADAEYEKRMAKPQVDPFAKERQDVMAAEEAAAKSQLEGRKGIAEDQSKLFDKVEARLAGRESGLEKEAKRNEAMAFINAGLQMMQAKGPGLAAIASGAQTGFSQYGAGLERLKAAQERIEESADKLAEARLGSRKEMLSAQGDYDKAIVAGKKDTERALRDVYGKNSEQALKLVQLGAQQSIADKGDYTTRAVAQGNNATTLEAARIQAAATRASAGRNTQLEMLQALSGNPQLLATYQAMHSKNPDVMDGFIEWSKANPMATQDKDGGLGKYLAVRAGVTLQNRVTNTPPAAGVAPR